jgi:predicted lipid-binding transport protein (Tim44 family)
MQQAQACNEQSTAARYGAATGTAVGGYTGGLTGGAVGGLGLLIALAGALVRLLALSDQSARHLVRWQGLPLAT